MIETGREKVGHYQEQKKEAQGGADDSELCIQEVVKLPTPGAFLRMDPGWLLDQREQFGTAYFIALEQWRTDPRSETLQGRVAEKLRRYAGAMSKKADEQIEATVMAGRGTKLIRVALGNLACLGTLLAVRSPEMRELGVGLARVSGGLFVVHENYVVAIKEHATKKEKWPVTVEAYEINDHRDY